MAMVLEEIQRTGIVPVVALQEADDALPLAQALMAGGLPCAEVTFRTACAEEAIRRMTAGAPDMLIGAGTVLTVEQAERAMAAGARFLVSPGFNPAVVQHCLNKGYPVLPGVCTPTELEAALSLGLTRLKFFPAEAAGGLKMIRALAAPYTMIRFMPTGGISPNNVRDYLSCEAVFACGGSWMVSGALLKARAFDRIQELTAEAVCLRNEVARG